MKEMVLRKSLTKRVHCGIIITTIIIIIIIIIIITIIIIIIIIITIHYVLGEF